MRPAGSMPSTACAVCSRSSSRSPTPPPPSTRARSHGPGPLRRRPPRPTVAAGDLPRGRLRGADLLRAQRVRPVAEVLPHPRRPVAGRHAHPPLHPTGLADLRGDDRGVLPDRAGTDAAAGGRGENRREGGRGRRPGPHRQERLRRRPLRRDVPRAERVPGAWWTMPVELYCSVALLGVLLVWQRIARGVRGPSWPRTWP